MNKKHYEIEIPETSQKQLYKKSMENIRLVQLKAKADLEAELDYQKKYIGSPMPIREKMLYYKGIIERFNKSKVLNLW